MGDYRISPIWNQARHFVLALSLIADSVGSSGKSFSEKIRERSVQLLLKIVELCEVGTDLQGTEKSIRDLKRILNEAHKMGFLTRAAFLKLTREARDLRAALRETSWNRGSASRSATTIPPTEKLSLPSFTGVFYD